MKSNHYISNIRNYSLISFLLPLIAISLCLFLYKSLGNANLYNDDFDFREKKSEYTLKEYKAMIPSYSENIKTYSFTNCPINKYSRKTCIDSVNERTIETKF